MIALAYSQAVTILDIGLFLLGPTRNPVHRSEGRVILNGPSSPTIVDVIVPDHNWNITLILATQFVGDVII